MIKRAIIVKYGVIGSICKDVGCSRNTVTLALNWVTDTDLARQIRDLAVNKYGGARAAKTHERM